MKEKLLKLMAKKNERKTEIVALSEKTDDVTELRALNTELDGLNEEVRSLQEMIDATPDEEVIERTAVVNGEIPGVVKASATSQKKRTEESGIDSPEYRTAFLKKLQGKSLTEVEEREYSLVPNTGGAAVPASTANKIYDNMTKIAPMLNEIELLRVVGNVRLAVQGVRNAAAAHAENAPIVPAADTLVTVTLSGFEFVKVIRISQTIQTMAIDTFENWLTKMLADDLAVAVDNQIINGGTVTGSISAAQVWADGVNQITYVPANGLTYSDITGLIALLPSAFDANAKFVMRKSTFYQQVLGMEDANGNPIAVPDIASPGKYNILGYPVLIDDNVTANEAFLGDYKQVVGNLSSDIKVDRSVESGFLANSVDFRGTCIFDCDVVQPTAIVKLDA